MFKPPESTKIFRCTHHDEQHIATQKNKQFHEPVINNVCCMSKNTELEKTPLYTIPCDIESKQTWLLAYNNIQFI